VANQRKKKRRGRTWSYRAGSRGCGVRVYERAPGGLLYAAAFDPSASNGRGGERRVSLGHRDREEAMRFADEQSARLRTGEGELRCGRPAVARILGLYLRHRTPMKSRNVQTEDLRQAYMWINFLGSNADLSKLSSRQWDGFVRGRRSGELDAHGEFVSDPAKRRSVRTRTVERDLKFLRAVCRWAIDFRDREDRLLLRLDPTAGREIPKPRNPKRNCASHDRVEKIREAVGSISMRVEWGGRREVLPSYLAEIFEIAIGTGRRISAVCNLRVEDFDLSESNAAPWGRINWPSKSDKQGKAWSAPINRTVRDALKQAMRKRRAVGPGWLFPAPKDPTRCVRYDQVSRWLVKAERLAGLGPQEGTLWHAYRRLWVSSRKHHPSPDVMRLGGWSSPDAFRLYQRPDPDSILRVLTDEAELREAR